MQIALRPALARDFEYCKRVYFTGMNRIIEELNLDRGAHAAGFQKDWVQAEVQIIALNGSDVGWLQSTTADDEVFLKQFYVDVPFQQRGIGTQVMNRIIADATRANKAVCLAVVKINPALRLYERLGFYVAHEGDRKFYMKRDPESAANSAQPLS